MRPPEGRWRFDHKTGRIETGQKNEFGNCFWVGLGEFGQLEALKNNWTPEELTERAHSVILGMSGIPLVVYTGNVEAMRLNYAAHDLALRKPYTHAVEAQQADELTLAIRKAVQGVLEKQARPA